MSLTRLFDPAATDEEIRSIIESIPVWECSGCGEVLRGASPSDAHPLCWECSKPKAQERPRAALLESRGCPARFARTPFQERSHPRDERHPGFRAGEWRGDPWSIGFSGGTNAGKTFLATELLYRCLPRVRSSAWRRADQIAEAYLGFRGAAERESAAQAIDCELLLLDDVGRGLEIAGRLGALNEIVSIRHANLWATIWTTNLTAAEISRLDGGMGRRLIEDGIVLSVAGEFKASTPRRTESGDAK